MQGSSSVVGKVRALHRVCSQVMQLLAAAIAGALSSVTALAQAADWPNRVVTVIGPFAPGGNNDIMARLASEFLSTELKQRFIVENRVGAGGAVAAAHVAQSAPDGYTLLFGASPQIGLVPFIQKVAYDPIKDFAPVSAFGSGPFVLAVNSSSESKTTEQFIAHAKGRQINYGSAGIGSVGHLSAALFVKLNGIAASHVPFRGGAPALVALLGGHIDMYFGSASEILPQAEEGKVRILGVAAEQPLKQMASVPIIKGTAIPTWNGFLAPAKTPKEIVDKLARAVIAATRDPGVVAQLQKLGIEPNGTTPEEFAEWIRRDQPQFDAAIVAAQLKKEQ